MLWKCTLILCLGNLLSIPVVSQEKEEKAPAEKDYVRIEVRGALKVEGNFIKVTATPTNFTEVQTWSLAFPGQPELRKQAEKLAGKTVVTKGDLRWLPGKLDKNGKPTVGNAPFHSAPWSWVVFVTELKAGESPKEK
jgi:hypothetical protein